MKCLKTSMLICLLVILALLPKAEAATAISLACGTWHAVSSPSPSKTGNELNAVEPISATNVWAVGATYFYNNGNETAQTLIEHWNGTRWSVVPSPSPGKQMNFLWGVAALSATNIWAVGNQTGTQITHTLIEHWDGTKWSVVPSPSPGIAGGSLDGVAAVSANDIWAVGYYSTKTTSLTLLEHWDGTQWSLVNPKLGMTSVEPQAIVALSSNNIWVVGDAYPYSGPIRPLIEHWNGMKWKVVPSPKAGKSNNYLHEVAAVSANNVWTVGSYEDNVGRLSTLIEHWNGTQWTVVSSPNAPRSDYNWLKGVTAVSASDVWAVGYDVLNSNGLYQTLIEHWDGTTWTVVKSANPLSNDTLNAVTAGSPRDVWAVGSANITNGPAQTLTEYFC